MPEEMITIADIRRAGYCVSGARRWFESHNLDFRKLLSTGYPASELLATGDLLAQKVVETKHQREQNNG